MAAVRVDEDTFIANRQALRQDPQFPLNGYPSMDETTAGLIADPYNPQTNGSLVRYPTQAGFDSAELAYGKCVVQLLASPLPPNLAQKFFNIRGVLPNNEAVGSTTWDWTPPTDPTPITDGPAVPGDGTQPAWTARLVTLNPNNVIALNGADVEHQFIMNSPSTLNALGNVLGV